MAAGKKRGSRKPEPAEDFEVELVEPARLKPHPRNYKQHPEDQLEHLCASVRQYGFYRPIVVARDYTILVGHGLALAAERLGTRRVPVKVLPLAPGSPQALKLLALDNELGRFAVGDDRALSEILREVRDADENGLLGTGYDDQNLAAFLMVTRPAAEIGSIDEAAEWVGMPEYEAGANPIRLLVVFRSLEDRKKFVEQYKIGVTKDGGTSSLTWSARWPAELSEDLYSLRFKQAR